MDRCQSQYSRGHIVRWILRNEHEIQDGSSHPRGNTPMPYDHQHTRRWFRSLLRFPLLCCGGRLANALVAYGQFFCSKEHIPEGIAPGDTWTSTSRGLCSVAAISAHLTLPDGKKLSCAHFPSYGTSSSLFSIIMDGVDGCCVRNSQSTNKVCS